MYEKSFVIIGAVAAGFWRRVQLHQERQGNKEKT